MTPVYLGDSVYAEIDPYGSLVITTNNGYPDDPRNRIVLEESVLKNLFLWLPQALKPLGLEITVQMRR